MPSTNAYRLDGLDFFNLLVPPESVFFVGFPFAP